MDSDVVITLPPCNFVGSNFTVVVYPKEMTNPSGVAVAWCKHQNMVIGTLDL